MADRAGRLQGFLGQAEAGSDPAPGVGGGDGTGMVPDGFVHISYYDQFPPAVMMRWFGFVPKLRVVGTPV